MGAMLESDCAHSALEVETATKQHISGWIGPCALSKVTVLEVCVYALIVHPVEEIECIQSQLQMYSLRNWSHFLQCEVYVSITGIPELVRHLIAFRTNRRKSKVAAGHNSAGTCCQYSATTMIVILFMTLLIRRDAGIVVIVSVGIEISAARSERKITQGSWKARIDKLRSKRCTCIYSKRSARLQHRNPSQCPTAKNTPFQAVAQLCARKLV